MKKNRGFYLFVIVTLLTFSLHAATFEDGQAAYQAEEYKNAVEIWQTLSEQGDIDSLLKMAELYSVGFNVKKDKAEAFKLYNQAAELGSLEAQLQLGLIYMSGQEDVKRDPEKAREYYLKAANQGYAKAQYYYGVTYFRGEGVSTDYVQAHAWMHVATVNGYEYAKEYSDQIAEILSEEQIEESKGISERLLTEIKQTN